VILSLAPSIFPAIVPTDLLLSRLPEHVEEVLLAKAFVGAGDDVYWRRAEAGTHATRLTGQETDHTLVGIADADRIHLPEALFSIKCVWRRNELLCSLLAF